MLRFLEVKNKEKRNKDYVSKINIKEFYLKKNYELRPFIVNLKI